MDQIYNDGYHVSVFEGRVLDLKSFTSSHVESLMYTPAMNMMYDVNWKDVRFCLKRQRRRCEDTVLDTKSIHGKPS
ncbi:hypothetical protein CEXT_387811 [Caerostris extrusa]|uniref:Uncharacterized protein n=1 Tax=Caerostris extrusa TaxID=172846 RepID=A0AAV4WAC0_CAEEX|nr:hypothetical protein CEXT_387811 [Caerostris extrusa]